MAAAPPQQATVEVEEIRRPETLRCLGSGEEVTPETSLRLQDPDAGCLPSSWTYFWMSCLGVSLGEEEDAADLTLSAIHR